MCIPVRNGWSRRLVMKTLASAPVIAFSINETTRQSHAAACGDANHFAAEAERMRQLAVAESDQAYGAVVVLDGCIVGYGPSRVIQDNNINAHAERVALWDAQKRLGRSDLYDAVIYSTSPPCMICQSALAKANIARMYVGDEAEDIGTPRGE